MKPLNQWPILPHEIFFGVFMLITWLRLIEVRGVADSDALIYLGFILVSAVLISICRAKETKPRWYARLLFYPVAMNVLFLNMKGAIPKIQSLRMDAFLQHIDSQIIGENLSLRLQSITHPGLTEAFSFCYILFFPYLLFSMVYYACGNFELLKKFFIGLFTVYGLGFLGYSLLPAEGPFVAMANEFRIPLDGGFITRWNSAIVAAGSNHVDVFPSLHCAVSSYFLLFDRQHRPWRFRIYLIPCIGLWISTIYLRYHYFIDVICGFALSAFALWLANRYALQHSAQPSSDHAPQLSTSSIT